MNRWLKFERYAVLGMGRSGVAAANLLASHGKKVLASDTRAPEQLDGVAAQLASGVELRGGSNHVGDAQVVIASPGLQPSLPIFKELAARGVPVVSEIELAWALSPAPIIAITGTDGKSTTTVLVEHILREAGHACIAGGNLGTPLCELVTQVDPDGYLVAEVSAFQLWTTHDFAPVAVGLTNIAADHLDYFDTWDEYVASKRRALKNAGAGTLGVFNMGDRYIRKWRDEFAGRAVEYALSEELISPAGDAFWMEGEALSARLGGVVHRGWLQDTAGLPSTGPHNLLNLMCAAGLVQVAGVSLEQVAHAARTFTPLAHRMEFVDIVDGVRFYDDSKATNVHAALAGLRSLQGPLVPIVGGVDKGLELADLVEFLKVRARAIVLIGALRERLGEELGAAGVAPEAIVVAHDMFEAVRAAKKHAEQGDDFGIVSLSPACSSFDMFRSYAHRGEVFQQAVAALKA